MTPPLPTGTVTFLLSDVEGSTAGWEADRAAMAAAIVHHYEIIDAAVRRYGGVRPVEQGEGDSIVAVFPLATQAIRAASEIQLAMDREPWPDGARLAVRVALHTGEAQLRDAGNYMGRTVIRAARLRAIGHGGQILCSGSTADVAGDGLPDGVTLLDLGAHRLKDLERAEHVFQVCHPDLRREFPPLRSLDAIPNNLPVYLTSFIGREGELADLVRLASQYRLVTLTGSGGAGKTRLAARVAAERAGNQRDGAWWVELAPLSNPELVTETVLGVLQVADAPGSSALQRLTAHLAPRELMLVLDNCEHVLEASATLVDAVLRGCPGVTVLATSREPLRVGGEIAWQIPSLALPAKDALATVESLTSYDAVRLFVDRSVRARPNFTVTNESAPVVTEICARLDGIPLAIELAAARTRVLTPQQILEGLQDRFRLLTGGGRALPRQQTLEASVAWSFDLLSEQERVLFRRLSVFAGGFTLDAAEAVAGGMGDRLDPGAVLDLLDGLVAKSLVVVDDRPGDAAARFRMLETIRAFAALKLSDAQETTSARDAHLRFCLAALREAEQAMLGITPELIRHLSANQDNYRMALDWALAADDPDPALDLAWLFALLLIYQGRYREARESAERALARPGGSDAARAATTWSVGLAQWGLCDVPAVADSAASLLDLAYRTDDARLQGRAHHLDVLLKLVADPPAAQEAIGVARPLAATADDRWILLDLAWDETFLAMRADDLAGARALFEAAQSAAEAYGNHWFQVWNLGNGVVIDMRAGRLAEARVAAERMTMLAVGLGEVQAKGWAAAVLAELDLLAGEPESGLARVDPAVRECTEAGAYLALPYAMSVRGQALAALGRDDARAALQEALAVAVEVEDDWARVQAALPLARLLIATGDPGAVPDLLRDVRRSGARLGSAWAAASADHVAGLLATAQGEAEKAEDLHQAALVVHAEQGYGLDVVDCLEALAGRAAGQESWAEAARLLAAAGRRRDELGYRRGRAGTAPTEAEAREGLGEEAFRAAWSEGEALAIDAAVTYARRARGERKRPSSGWASLTPAELEVARLAAEGLSNAGIGAKLFISGGTAKIHLSRIYTKLGLANRAQLTAEVMRRETD